MEFKHILYFGIIFLLSPAISAQDEEEDEEVQRLINLTRTTTETSYSTSHARMIGLMKNEKGLIANLKSFVNEMQEKVDLINFAVTEMDAVHTKADQDPEEYLANPLHAFSLMRRMHSDWTKWQSYMNSTVGQAQIDYMNNLTFALPTRGDLNDSVRGVDRIITTHELKPEEFSNGLINGVHYGGSMDALDCYAVADYLDDTTQYDSAETWYRLALQKYNHRFDKLYELNGFYPAKVYYLIAETLRKRHRVHDAIEAIEEAVYLDPNNTKYSTYRRQLHGYVNMGEGCRGNFAKTNNSKLRCYLEVVQPHLMIAPLKYEHIHTSPDVLIVHDVLHDNEIDELKQATMSKLMAGQKAAAELLDGNTVAFRSNTSHIAKKIIDRVVQMTGARPSEKDTLNVGKFLPGMFPLYHESYITPEENPISIDKIEKYWVSVLFSLNNVEAGGATVFPFAETAITPEKGSALLTFHGDCHNFNKDSVYTSCPIIAGYKWTATQMLKMEI